MSENCEIQEPERVEEELVSHMLENKVYDGGPRAWTVGYSSLGGRGLFATRDIHQGELIFVDAPLLIGPRCIQKYLPMCATCYKRECPLFPCDHGCGLPVCSSECENSPKHVDHECKYLRSLVYNRGSDWSPELLLALTPIRAVFMTDQQRRCLSTLQCHRGLIHGQEVELLCRNVANKPPVEDIELMKRVCGVFNTNSFETVSVQDKDSSTSLRALYPMGALQNHRCVPNTRHHFDSENRLYVSATHPINAGEELTMAYTCLFWDTALRRQFLSATKQFWCNCKRCSDPTEFGSNLAALLCATDTCTGNLLPSHPLNIESPWVCDKCKMTIHFRQIALIRSGLAALVEELQYKHPRRMLRFIETELSDLVPQSNYLMVDMKFRMISYFGRTNGLTWKDVTDSELATKRSYCLDLLSILDALNSGDCTKRGLILYELYCTNIEQMDRLQKVKNGSNEHPINFTQIDMDENKQLLEKATNILQNDILSITLQESDKIF